MEKKFGTPHQKTIKLTKLSARVKKKNCAKKRYDWTRYKIFVWSVNWYKVVQNQGD